MKEGGKWGEGWGQETDDSKFNFHGVFPLIKLLSFNMRCNICS
jgi:hypothetical protein